MRDVMELAGSPIDEDGVSVNKEGDYHDAMRAECRRFKAMLEKRFPDPPPGTYFKIRSNPHDFGTYYEVGVSYDMDDPESEAFAFMCEANLPAKWTDAEVFRLPAQAVALPQAA